MREIWKEKKSGRKFFRLIGWKFGCFRENWLFQQKKVLSLNCWESHQNDICLSITFRSQLLSFDKLSVKKTHFYGLSWNLELKGSISRNHESLEFALPVTNFKSHRRVDGPGFEWLLPLLWLHILQRNWTGNYLFSTAYFSNYRFQVAREIVISRISWKN